MMSFVTATCTSNRNSLSPWSSSRTSFWSLVAKWSLRPAHLLPSLSAVGRAPRYCIIITQSFAQGACLSSLATRPQSAILTRLRPAQRIAWHPCRSSDSARGTPARKATKSCHSFRLNGAWPPLMAIPSTTAFSKSCRWGSTSPCCWRIFCSSLENCAQTRKKACISSSAIETRAFRLSSEHRVFAAASSM